MKRRNNWSRRDALKGVAAAAAVSCGGPDPITDDSGEGPAPKGQIDSVIFVMMENRSFDHFLGGRRLTEGRTDEDGLTEDMSNPGADGSTVTPFPSDDPCLTDPPHGWNDSHDQWNNGANDGFCKEYAGRSGGDGAGVMAYQTRENIPITWALADNFTVCDRSFASVMGPTWPNRLFAHSGSSEGHTSNGLPDEGLYPQPTVWTHARESGVDWAYYYSDVPAIALFKQHWDPDRVLLIEEFFAAAAEGRLPPVVMIDPAFTYNDNHPPHHPALGELFLASIYEALASSPQWERILLIITYDEHGGFFDHVSPPTTDDDRASEGFDQLGFRVPTLLVGPWVKAGVDSTVFDHTSWLKFLCDRHGWEPWTARIAAASSLAAALDTDRMERNDPLPAPPLPDFPFDPETVGEECEYGGVFRHAPVAALAELAKRQQMPLRLNKTEVAAPFLRAGRRTGLIG